MAPCASQIGRSIKVALQGACACRGLTTSAARAQSSSKASIASTIDTSRPPAIAPMQPMESQRVLTASEASFGCRPSASAASHSFTAKVSRPLCRSARRPSGPRIAAVSPSAEISTSGRGASIALEPANTAYEVRILPPNRVRIQGKLVGLFRRY